jgi:hypothetical protein
LDGYVSYLARRGWRQKSFDLKTAWAASALLRQEAPSGIRRGRQSGCEQTLQEIPNRLPGSPLGFRCRGRERLRQYTRRRPQLWHGYEFASVNHEFKVDSVPWDPGRIEQYVITVLIFTRYDHPATVLFGKLDGVFPHPVRLLELDPPGLAVVLFWKNGDSYTR